jgi:hypothetical protein
LHRRSSLRDVEPARLCREPTRTLNKNQEEPFAVAEALTLEAPTLQGRGSSPEPDIQNHIRSLTNHRTEQYGALNIGLKYQF